MRKSLFLAIIILLTSCATNFNKKKKINSEKMLGESILKQDGETINKLQVFDQIGSNSTDIEALADLKQDYALALGTAAAGGAIVGLGLVRNSDSSSLLLGALLAGVGYYFAIRVDEKLKSYIDKHNNRVAKAGLYPMLFIGEDGHSIVNGVGYNFPF